MLERLITLVNSKNIFTLKIVKIYYLLCPKISAVFLLRRLAWRSRLLPKQEIQPTILRSTTQKICSTSFWTEEVNTCLSSDNYFYFLSLWRYLYWLFVSVRTISFTPCVCTDKHNDFYCLYRLTLCVSTDNYIDSLCLYG